MVLTSIIGKQFEGSIDILAKLTGKLEIQIQFELSHRVSQYISRDKKLSGFNVAHTNTDYF